MLFAVHNRRNALQSMRGCGGEAGLSHALTQVALDVKREAASLLPGQHTKLERRGSLFRDKARARDEEGEAEVAKDRGEKRAGGGTAPGRMRRMRSLKGSKMRTPEGGGAPLLPKGGPSRAR